MNTRRRPLRVLVLDQGPGMWGAQRYLARLAPLLADRGVALTLAGPRHLALHREWVAAGRPAVALDLPVDRSIRSAGRVSPVRTARAGVTVASVAGRIARIARDGGFDAIWANSHWIHPDAALAGRLSAIPSVLHLHEEAVPGVGAALRSASVRCATRAVAVSRAVADGLSARARASVTVIGNGVDTTRFAPDPVIRDRIRSSWGVGPDDVVVVASTRIDPEKRIEDLVAAIADVPDARVRLVVAGSTSVHPDYAATISRVAHVAAPGRVAFHGHVEDIRDLLCACDIAVHAGVVEGMPLGLLEAQACGLPVVAYRVSGVPEAVADGTTGILVPPRDRRALAGALTRLASSPTERRAMGIAARARVATRHRLDDQADRNVALVSAVVGAHERSGDA